MSYIGSKPANKPVVASDLDPTIITGQTALAVAPADTDEFLISDAGVLKRLDASLIGGGGKVLQVLSDAATAEVHTTAGNGTFVDTGLSQAITPATTGSKILIFCTMSNFRKTGDVSLNFKVLRDTTDILQQGNFDTGDSQQLTEVINFHFLDSPSTASAVTYKVQFASSNGKLAANSNPAHLTLIEIGA